MKKNSLLLTSLLCIPLMLASCGDKNDSSSSSSSSSQTSSGDTSSGSTTSVKPDAPVDQYSISLADFAFGEVQPAPAISGIDFVHTTTYTYCSADFSTNIGRYSPGVATTIPEGTYGLKARISSDTYNTFELKTTFTVSLGTLSGIGMIMSNYDYDVLKPTPVSTGVPVGATVTYKYYENSNDKHDYIPGVTNDILPGSYTMEATYHKDHYNDFVKTYGFEVITAEFDEAYALSSNTLDIGETDKGFNFADII